MTLVTTIIFFLGLIGCSENSTPSDDTDASVRTDSESATANMVDTVSDADSLADTTTHRDTEPISDWDSNADTGTSSDTGAVGSDSTVDTETEMNTTLPVIAGCTVFSEDDEWNRDISNATVDEEWTDNMLALAGDVNLHPDFGNWDGREWGIPINIVPATQPMRPVVFEWYPDESDPGPYPFPSPEDARIEGGDAYDCSGDCHLLTLQQGDCMLYESGNCTIESGEWHCACGAVFDLNENSYGQRPMGWTSADAAGLSIAAGLIRYSEIVDGDIRHAIRFTMPCSRSNYVPPASHYAVPGGCTDSPTHPPMGMRVRLRADYDISPFNQTAQVILRAMKRYGMILADNGAAFYFQAETNPGWNGDEQQLKDVPADAFEVITPGPMGP